MVRMDDLEAAYLAASGGSGYAGDRRRWERARKVVLAAVHRGGDFLDVGCANGLLMESLTEWSSDQRAPLRLHGLDVSQALAQRARESLPVMADRIHVGAVMTWTPPQRFDFVRIELVYAPPSRRRALVRRCLDRLVATDGRLLVCSYRSAGEAHAVDHVDTLAQWGHRVGGRAQALDEDGSCDGSCPIAGTSGLLLRFIEPGGPQHVPTVGARGRARSIASGSAHAPEASAGSTGSSPS